MSSHYDSYDYPAYWKSRSYEHESEVIALTSFLDSLPKATKLLDIGGGFGRLVPYYADKTKNIVLSDPSEKLLKEARKRLKLHKNIKFTRSTIHNLPSKLKSQKFDVIVMVRVLHHVGNIEETFATINKLLKPGGYIILEYANKVHVKEILKRVAGGDFTFPIDIFNVDKRSSKSKKKNSIPFLNFHPGRIEKKLKDEGLITVNKRSVSNVRSPFLKKNIPHNLLLKIEAISQKPLALVNFGPSIFVLVKKKG